MTRQQAKEAIIMEVTECQGCKATQLIANLSLDVLEHNLPDMIEELIVEGKLKVIEYVIPRMTYRTKQFLLPIGTEINIK